MKELIEAWNLVTTEHTKDMEKEFGWELIIAGWDDGGHEEGLKQQAAELGLWAEDGRPRSEIQHQIPSVDNSIHFVRPQFGDDKDRLLRSVDAFILPSYSEGLPMSVLEAWAYGLPVVMTEFCNLPEGFAAKAAIRITPDPASIRRGLDNLAAMPATERSAMGTRGRELVRDRFTWEKVAEEMLAVYHWCLDGGTPPECVKVD